MRALTEREPQGVVTYRDGVPVGWCSIGPRSRNTRLTRSKLIRPVVGTTDAVASKMPRLVMRRML